MHKPTDETSEGTFALPPDSRTPQWSGSEPLSYKERADNLAVVLLHCGECIICDEANKVQPQCLIPAPWLRSSTGTLRPALALWMVTGGLESSFDQAQPVIQH
ncbi:hypothetical protein WMY93_007221 [Mugilogobius chulae]|uniref:Uncharacterized protein n=1 Tax=Mugilogobius chulae TaxID=88201 RepID=A0AAW0PQP0_9GOBI